MYQVVLRVKNNLPRQIVPCVMATEMAIELLPRQFVPCVMATEMAIELGLYMTWVLKHVITCRTDILSF